MNWKKTIITITSLAVVGLAATAAYNAYDGRGVAASTGSGDTAAPPVITTQALPDVAADGYVVPRRYATLSLATAGTVAEVYAVEGDAVEAGQAILALDNAAQAAALAQAEANLAQAEAALAQLQAGARTEEIAQAEAAVAAAQARLDRLVAGATPEQVAVARQAVAVAQANLERAQSGPTPEQLTAAEASIKMAEANLRRAQADYDKVAGRADVGATPQSLALEQATIEYERARASYDDLVNGATAAELRVYEEQLRQAQAQLAEVTAEASPADVAAAQADVDAAEAALALLRAGARTEEIAAAEAQVRAARSQVEQARAALDATILTAPFAGTVSAINVKVGEFAAPGAPLVKIGDASAWLVETDNLSELEVVHLREGEMVEVHFDALPDAKTEGTVLAICPAAEAKRGEMTYTVTIALEDGDLPLRWGMTAAVLKR